MTEPELLQGGTAHHSRHERDVVSKGSRGGYPPDPDAILRYPGNVLVGLSDNRVRINESESEEGVEVNESVSARTRASKTKTDSHTAKGEQSRQPSRRFQRDAVDASSAADATHIFKKLEINSTTTTTVYNLLPLSSGAPNGRGPGFIEPAEPAIATPLRLYIGLLVDVDRHSEHAVESQVYMQCTFKLFLEQ